jgi:hypothetical protein
VIRQDIEVFGCTPFVVCDSVGAYWNGFTLIGREGQLKNAITEGTKNEIVKIVLAGHLGEEMNDVLVDSDRWQRIYDDLIDVPNAERIARDSLDLCGQYRTA